MNKPRIVSFLFNEFVKDIRVLKENVSFAQNNFDALLVATMQKGLPPKESIKGFNVERIEINYIPILPFQLFFFWLKCVWKYRKEKIFHCNDLYALPAGVLIKLLFNKNAKVVYDAHEHETEAHVYHGKPVIKFFAKKIERWAIKYADAVICVSESIANDYVRLYNIPKPHIVLNAPPYKTYEKTNYLREKFNIPQDVKIILYQGEYLKGRGIENITEGFKKYKGDKYVSVFLGYGAHAYIVEEAAAVCNKIFVHPAVSQDEFMKIVCSADYGIHIMENTCLNHDYALPNKLFEYIMAGLPVIVSNLTEMKRVVELHKIGVVLNENSPNGLLDALENKLPNVNYSELYANLNRAAKQYNWENQEIVLNNIYQSFIK